MLLKEIKTRIASNYLTHLVAKNVTTAVAPTSTLKHQQPLTKQLTPTGSSYPLEAPDSFNLRDVVSVRELFQYRVHLGHRSVLRNEYMTPYLFGCRQGIDIVDLEQTKPLLFDALNFTAHIAYRGGIILFVSQHPQMLPLVEQTAQNAGEYSHCRRWNLGTFTDTKNTFGQAVRLPDLIIFLSTLTVLGQPHLAVRDSAKMLIPTVGVVDTNADPRLVTYPVPGNDDTPTTVRLWCALFAEAIKRGKRRAARDQKLLLQQTDSPTRIPHKEDGLPNSGLD